MTQIPMHSISSLTLASLYQAQITRLLAYQQAIEAELTRRNLQDLPIEKLLRLSDLLPRQLQRLLKAAPPASNQIKPDQASLVEVRFQPAGEGGFQPPVPPEPLSTQIKVDQASGEITASEAPHSEFKVQRSASKVQGSEPSTLNSQPSTMLEHCLRCAEPLPALLPNGRRPDRYCKCGNPIVVPPGTSRLERCPHCGEVQRPHGYNAFRHDNRCHKCWRDLPPLDPKSPTPWLPPARPAPAPTKG